MYNDYKLIDDSNADDLLVEYNKEIKVKTYNLNEEFLTKFNALIKILTLSKHNVINIVNLSKNSNDLETLKQIITNLDEIISKLYNLYDISVAENDVDYNQSNNNNLNIKQAVNTLLTFLEEFYNFILVEDNIKIKNSLNNMFFDIIKIIKQLNNLLIIKPKIFSLFKKY